MTNIRNKEWEAISNKEWEARMAEYTADKREAKRLADEAKSESILAQERKTIKREALRASKSHKTWQKYVKEHPITPNTPEDEDEEISHTWKTVGTSKSKPIPIPMVKKAGRKSRKSRKTRKTKKSRKSRKTKKSRKSKKTK